MPNRKKRKSAHNPGERKLVTQIKTDSFIAEQYRTIRTNLQFSLPNEKSKTILVTSSIPGEGKSTTAANLAVVFAQEGKKVLIIDADMRRPTLHQLFDVFNLEGLSNLLSRQRKFSEVVQETEIENLYIVPSGNIPPNHSELLYSKNLDLLINHVKQIYDIIIFDTPPLLSVSDALILSNKCDGTLLIVSSGKVNKTDVKKAITSLETSQAKIIGVVLNNLKMNRSSYYY
ncbi:capsular exopolysaccharide synthesis family protein [Ureibacillus xyleni]|uniref:non-specific protein-tyrosine kinase n=1 Tax=Ureibacillus xyleni TaxID=614648 RepID=A0A285RHY0_9BACL|nr:CpsD/CapB family tyrosine-protein kinase [Ureibacillus xyleni]SOB93681.1 capsular exopolysaccharide synthesis family protein [Ureibacillus xyleni]